VDRLDGAEGMRRGEGWVELLGKVTFAMSDSGRTHAGKWGYCDADPDTDFQAKWDGK
jgi:hypothetical protein